MPDGIVALKHVMGVSSQVGLLQAGGIWRSGTFSLVQERRFFNTTRRLRRQRLESEILQASLLVHFHGRCCGRPSTSAID